MRALGVLVCSLALGVSPIGAQQQVDRRWPLAPDGAVKIFNFVGSVRVVGWDRDSVVVTGTLPRGRSLFGGGSPAGVKLGVDGDQRSGDDAAALIVRVPAGANVWVRGAATDIEASGLIGTLDIGTVTGRVTVTGSPRILTAESMSGAVAINGSAETLRAKTAGGALDWKGSARDAHLVSVSGDIRVSAGPLERANIETISGAVRVDATLRAESRVSIETHGGNVDLRLPRGSPLRLDVDAAEVSGTGIATWRRPADHRLASPPHFEFNLGEQSAPAPLVSIRSFKGRFVLGFVP